MGTCSAATGRENRYQGATKQLMCDGISYTMLIKQVPQWPAPA